MAHDNELTHSFGLFWGFKPRIAHHIGSSIIKHLLLAISLITYNQRGFLWKRLVLKNTDQKWPIRFYLPKKAAFFLILFLVPELAIPEPISAHFGSGFSKPEPKYSLRS